MATLFIADLHLCQEEPATVAGFLHFLAGEARNADALYILGDLFEAWIGDDDLTPVHLQVADALRTLNESGVPCYFVHGNRDFLVGPRFARRSKITILPEIQKVILYDRPVLIMHGDTLCTDDKSYQKFRAKVHTIWIQRVFLTLPLFIRKRIARRMRAGSQHANQNKALAIMDVNPDTVQQIMMQNQVQWLIHGHTHRPAIHPLSINGKPAWRCVLGAWHEQGSMIRVTFDDVELIEFPY